MTNCTGFTWQGFGRGGAAGVAPGRRDQELPLCWTQAVPASSKTDPPLAKAEPIGDAGGISMITCLRKG